MAEGVEPVALRQVHGREGEVGTRVAVGAEDGEVVDDVDAEDGDGAWRSEGIDELGAVAVGVVNELRDDVVVGDDVSGGGDEEARADGGFGGGAGLDDLDLDDAVGEATEDVGGGDGLALGEKGWGGEEQQGDGAAHRAASEGLEWREAKVRIGGEGRKGSW